MSEIERRDEEALLNLQEKSNDELRALLDELSQEENELSLRRRVLHGRIDILRAELVRRLADERTGTHDVIKGSDIDRLIEILASDLRAVKRPAPDEADQDE